MTGFTSIQPWGHAPTPLIPKALLDDLGNLPIPPYLRKSLNGCSSFNNLYRNVWRDETKVGAAALKALVAILGPKIRSLDHIDIRSGEPLQARIEDLPFSTRTRNIILKNVTLFQSEQLTFADVLRVPNMGVKSALEFACVIEAAISIVTKPLDHMDTEQMSVNPIAQSTQSDLNRFFQLLGAYAAGEKGVKTIAGVLPAADEEWPTELKQLWKSVGVLESRALAGDLIQKYSITALLEQWINPIEERLRIILVRRTFKIGRRETLRQLGSLLGITRERVRQLETKARQHLISLQHTQYGSIMRTADQLRHRIGSAVPEEDWDAKGVIAEVFQGINHLDKEMSEFAIGTLVYLAGPYKAVDGWVVTDEKLAASSKDDLLSRADDRGLISNTSVSDHMSFNLIGEKYRMQWIHHLQGFKRVDNGYIYLAGSILDKARALLQYHNRPLAVEEMIPDLGSASVKSVRQRLMDDPGFWRVNKKSEFVIASTPGYDEYTGITEEILQELEACGGRATVQHLVSKLTSVYGVKENSVHAYLSTPLFTRDANGLVRLRRNDEPLDIKLDISKAAGCYIDGNGNWCWRVEVDSALMRGSGRMVPNAFADLFGCGIDDRIEIQSNYGPIVISWPASSSVGATIGSIRDAVLGLGCEIGDYIFVAKCEHGLSFTRLSVEALESANSKLERLLMLVGREGNSEHGEIVRRLSGALRVSGATDEERLIACRLMLKSKGETQLARHIEEQALSLDGYLSNMQKMFRK